MHLTRAPEGLIFNDFSRCFMIFHDISRFVQDVFKFLNEFSRFLTIFKIFQDFHELFTIFPDFASDFWRCFMVFGGPSR